MVTYVAETCPACGGLHIVNPANGRMMSDDRRPSVSTGSRLTRGAPRPDLWA